MMGRILWLVATLVLPTAAVTQEIRLERPLGTSTAERVLEGILQRGQYLVLTRDTVLPASFTTPGDLIINGADVRLEGSVGGDVAVLAGDFFVRPRARVAGSIAVIGGEAYPSGLASVGPVLRVPHGTVATINPDTVGPVLRVTAPPEPPRFVLPGTFGFALPTYDRVNGVRLIFSPQYRFTGDTLTGPSIDAFVSYAFGLERLGGGVRVLFPLDSSTRAVARVERATFTNENWIRGPLFNSLLAAGLGIDERNYYESDRLSVGLTRVFIPEVSPGLRVAPRLVLIASRDRPLPVTERWSLLGDGLRPENPRINTGTLVSAILGGDLRYRGRQATFLGEAWVEQGIPEASDFTFTHGVATGLFQTPMPFGHRVSVRFRVMQPLAGDVPRQRYSFVGGPGTLPHLEVGELWGDHLRFLVSTYSVPLPQITLRYIGSPALQLTHTAGVAWRTGLPEPDWEQAIGVGLQFFPGYISVQLDPAADGLDPRLGLGVSFSLGG